MKKELSLFFVLIIIACFLISQVKAAALDDTMNKIDQTVKQADSTISNIPKTPEEARDKYLKQEWGALIAKNKVLGPIHTFLSNNQWLFKYTLNYRYELTLTFFCILFLWLWLTIWFSGLIGGGDLFKSLVAAFLGAVAASIIAYTGAITLVVTTLLNFIFSQQLWWMRILIGIIIIAVFIFLQPLSRLIRKHFTKSKEKKKKEEQEHKIE